MKSSRIAQWMGGVVSLVVLIALPAAASDSRFLCIDKKTGTERTVPLATECTKKEMPLALPTSASELRLVNANGEDIGRLLHMGGFRSLTQVFVEEIGAVFQFNAYGDPFPATSALAMAGELLTVRGEEAVLYYSGRDCQGDVLVSLGNENLVIWDGNRGAYYVAEGPLTVTGALAQSYGAIGFGSNGLLACRSFSAPINVNYVSAARDVTEAMKAIADRVRVYPLAIVEVP